MEGRMTELELRQKIDRQLGQLALNQLAIVSAFLDSLPSEDPILFWERSAIAQRPLRRLKPVKRAAKAIDLLKFAGTWQGNDLEECLRVVHETRSKSQF
jgi:hypothetical protein